ALTQLLGDTRWGGEDGLDYLVVDLPPGTGDIQLTLAQKIPVAGAVVVTTPQDVATLDARKALRMFEKVGVAVLGLVENMAQHVCSNCGHVEHLFGQGGGERMAAQYGVPLLGSLPLEIGIREQGDAGVPIAAAAPEAAGARAYRDTARRLLGELDRRPRAPRGSSASLVSPQPLRRARPAGPAGGGAPYSAATRRVGGKARRMGIKGARRIRRMAEQHGMIEPYEPGQVKEAEGGRIVSYGTSSYGYDVRCSREFKVFTNINSTIVDPKHFDPKSFVDIEADVCIIPPNSFALARTVEYFRIPRDTLVVCLGKSTYARCGIIVNVTPLEPEWEGHVTLEFSNTTPLPARIYANEGVAQMLFFQSD